MRDSKIILAKEYLLFLKLLLAVTIIYLLSAAIEWTINKNRTVLRNDIFNSQVLLDSNKNLRGSKEFSEKSQLDLYTIVNDPGYYTKSFSEFKPQFSSITSKMRLYIQLRKDEVISIPYESFRDRYFPKIDSSITHNIDSLTNRIFILKAKDHNKIDLLKWYYPLILLAIIYIVRILFKSIGKASNIIKSQNGV